MNFQTYKNANADVCIFIGMDEKLGMEVQDGGLAHDLASELRLPADVSIQATFIGLMKTHPGEKNYKTQIISTLPALLCYPAAPSKRNF